MKRSKHEMGLFQGIGNFIPSKDRRLPPTGMFERSALLLIKQGKDVGLLEIFCQDLARKELVYRAAGRWTTTWKGDAVLKELEQP